MKLGQVVGRQRRRRRNAICQDPLRSLARPAICAQLFETASVRKYLFACATLPIFRPAPLFALRAVAELTKSNICPRRAASVCARQESRRRRRRLCEGRRERRQLSCESCAAENWRSELNGIWRRRRLRPLCSASALRASAARESFGAHRVEFQSDAAAAASARNCSR